LLASVSLLFALGKIEVSIHVFGCSVYAFSRASILCHTLEGLSRGFRGKFHIFGKIHFAKMTEPEIERGIKREIRGKNGRKRENLVT
jgi:hypothetical protein